MRRFRFVAAAGLVLLLGGLATTAARAGQPFLAWDECDLNGGSNIKAFACNTNSGSETLVSSFVPPAGMTELVGIEVVLDLMTSPNLTPPDWWAFRNSGACRESSLTTDFDFTSNPVLNCMDYWAGRAVGGLTSWEQGFGGSLYRVRCKLLMVVPRAAAREVSPDSVYYAFKLRMNHDHTVGPGECSGCLQPMCAVITGFNLVQPPGVGDYQLAGHSAATVYWQTTIAECPAWVPTRNRTWGAIKTMYR